ncbi:MULTISPECIES: dinucleotide-utilizing enzyme [unclassified Microbacterium]|uniref:dinucleotide-utilizing enzyme n=1 Tax=unclassified Microbacterium TaxID=2609290 RepID=UPI00214B0571|nr:MULTISPECIES: dinucleotide-utilizing enzyme [unclassified Microbacterium]MCR2785806.1 dinucleotide-utilizing enzyme [Microbacterium sp. zg.B96]WIM17215.1 dinucleotide-utilizing enzyme [Microbacterium sp. zg-B96]
MSSRPRLVRSIPFWVLIAGSLASGIAGALILTDRLGVMSSALTDGTATGVEVYVGQIEAVFGAILVGAGIVGLALALTVASLRSAVPAAVAAAPVAAAEPIDWSAEHAAVDASDAPNEPVRTAATTHEEPAITRTPADGTGADAAAPRA